MMKRWILILIMAIPSLIYAQDATKYFGYYYNDAKGYNSTGPGFDDNNDHINLYHIDFWSGDTSAQGREVTTNYVLGELKKAQQKGVKAVITAIPFVFQLTSGKWVSEPNASAVWSVFVNRLVGDGYIIPGNARQSTVAAIYVFDEPDVAGFVDVDGQPNPAMSLAINAIRGNPSTANIPLATVVTPDFDKVQQSINRLDWIGFDDYSLSQSKWYKVYNKLKAALSANQRTILVPKATMGGSVCGVGGKRESYSDPNEFFDILNNDATAIWLMPFHWFSSSAKCLGVKDIPSLRSVYSQKGLSVRQKSDPVIGYVDGITYDAAGNASVGGWACTTFIPQSISVDLYLGGVAGGGGIGIARYSANQSSEPQVQASCGVTSGSYRYTIPLGADLRSKYAGKTIFVQGISSINGVNNPLSQSGMFVVPAP